MNTYYIDSGICSKIIQQLKQFVTNGYNTFSQQDYQMVKPVLSQWCKKIRNIDQFIFNTSIDRTPVEIKIKFCGDRVWIAGVCLVV
jgi:predicted unusual protein kinase regulating ubiquinone biosynthesis (AarF/ABC1/UbiB family)